jgi:hypothetical protein
LWANQEIRINMTKNMTRKGLAIGAGLVLTATGLVASPAYAADLSLVASAGTTYSVFQSDEFTLNSAITGNTNIANTAAWKWEVVNPSAVTLAVAGEWWNAGNTAYEDSLLSAGTLTGSTTIYTPGTGLVTQTIGKVNAVTINPTTASTTATFSVTVRSFSDLDGSGSVTSGDLVSDAQTLTFVKGSEVTGTVTMDALTAGVAATATLTLDKGINYEMTTLANVTNIFTVNGADAPGTTTRNTANTAFVLTGAPAAAGQIISAKGLWTGYDSDTTLSSATSATSTTNAASLATTAEASIANGDNIAAGVAAGGGQEVVISKLLRSGTKSLSYDVTFKVDATTAVTVASPVTIVVTEVGSTLVLGDDVTVNGKKLVATANPTDSVTTYATTDANGKLTISVTSANASDLENITIVATSNTGDVFVDLKWVDAAVDNVYVTNALANDTIRTIAKGSSVSLNYVVIDQFDKAWTRTDYSYRLEFSKTGTITAPSALNLSNGSGTLNFTDNSTAASGTSTLIATLSEQTGAGAWTPIAPTVTTTLNVVASVSAPVTIATATALLDDTSAIAVGGVPLADVDLAALDNRVYNNANASLGVSAGSGAKLVATVKSATGSNLQGAAVTVSGAGLYFSTTIAGTGVVSKDSIVLNSTAGGAVTVFVYGQVSGKQTITFTAGSATKTQDVTWAAAAAATGTTLTVNTPATAMPGSTFMVTGTLTDKYGNPVQIATAGTGVNPTLAVSYVGPGLVSGSLPTTTSAAGMFTFYVLLGSNDSGTATVTASFDADGTTATKAAVVTTASVTVGEVVVVSEAKVNAGSFKGYVALYAKGYEGKKMSAIVAGKWIVVASLASDFERVVRFTGAGYDIVATIYIDGVMISTFNVTTK